MAASTAIVVRRRTPTAEPTITATMKRRARGHRRGNAVNLKQLGYGIAGAAASATVTAGLVSWLDMRPWIAGLATGGIGAVGAVALSGPIMRPFATGAALAGGAVAMTSALLPVRQVPAKSPDKEQKEPAKQLSSGSASAAPSQREAGTVSDAMRMQIRQAMRQR